jgi:hypothetical protein
MLIIGVLLLIPLGLVISYILIPVYYHFRYRNGDRQRDYLFVWCLWAIALIPFISYELALYLEHQFPLYNGGGEPGLNFGLDDIPPALCLMLVCVAHSVIWVLLKTQKSNL